MENDRLMLCDACSQLMTLRIETLTNEMPAKFCPYCGSPRLRKVRSAVREVLSGICFSNIDDRLVLLLYGVWRGDRANAVQYPRFVDFVVAQLEGAE